MRLEDLNWLDVEKYLEQDDRIILVTGATEQHAYLSLMTDVLIPLNIADAVAKRESVLVAPPLNFGISYPFREFPGTISLSKNTFDSILIEIYEGLVHQGFKKFLILNGHGGNQLPEKLKSFAIEKGEIHLVWYDWWRSDVATAFSKQQGLIINHANWGENFPFNRVAESPKDEKQPIDIDKWNKGEVSARDTLGDGSFGGPYQVNDEVMNALFEAVVTEVATIVRSLKTV